MCRSAESLNKIIVRIRKLMYLANGGATEAEAEQAMRMAHALLAEHNLSLTEIMKEASDTLGDRVIDSEYVDGVNDPWRRSIWHATADLYFCSYFYSPKYEWRRGKQQRVRIRHNLVGKPHNILVTKLMVQYLVNTVRRLARESARNVPPCEHGSFENSFKVACAKRLVERIWDRRYQSEEHPTTAPCGTTLPALRSLYATEMEANQVMIEHKGIGLESKRSRCRVTNVLGADAGRKAAEDIGLDTQVGHHLRTPISNTGCHQLELPI